jgi:nicotinamidase-related amidase
MRRALLVVDMLVDFVEPDGELRVPDNEKILPRVMAEVSRARQRGDPIIFLCDAHAVDDPEFAQWPPHAIKGTRGAQVVAALAPDPDDPIVEKTTLSGFYGSRLEEVLRERAVDTVRLTGCVTNICVLFVAFEAAVRGFRLEVVEDAVAALDPEDHAFALRQMKQVLGAKTVRSDD